MPYNIDNWKTKELTDLRIPVASLFKHERKDWHPKRTNNDDGSVSFDILESSIRGRIEGDWLAVSSIRISGEGSGTASNWIVEPAFAESTGRLVATRIWEGGDSIDRIVVDNGVVETHAVDL